jgi:glycosyltransferase involved in cell wall biosynthesis
MSTHPTPRITVITPSFNQGDYLERAICSVLDQGYDNLEYIVIDGGSADGSADIIQTYDRDLAYWHSQPDGGPADAINQALARATGDIIAVLNADDLYLPGTLDQIAKRMGQPDAPGWVVGHSLRIGEMDEQLGQLNATRPDNLASFLTQDAGHLPAPATFYRRSLFEAYGRFDPQMQYAWGYELNCRLIAQDQVPTILPSVLAAHREHSHSKTARHTLQSGLEFIDAAARYADRLPSDRRSTLWNNIDERRRVYALAEAETKTNTSRGLLWRQLLRRPWWLANDRYRQTLLRGVAHPNSLAGIRTDAPAARAA